jgi:hypothetical protein
VNTLALSSGAKWIGVGLLLLALAGFAAWTMQRLIDAGKASARAQVAEQAIKQAATNAAESSRRDAQQRENHREADRFNAQADADGRDLDRVVRRLRDERAASARRSAADPVARAGSAPDAMLAPELVLPDDVCGRAEQAAADAAKSLDCWRSAGKACEADYGALTP